MNKKLALCGVLGAAFLAAPAHFAHAQAISTMPASPSALPPSGPALARIEERLNQMDQQLRDMTGKIEQQQFATTQMQQNQTNVLADVQRRMQDLEVRVNTVGASSSATAPAMPTPAPVENKAATLTPPATPGATEPAPVAGTPSTSPAPVTAAGTPPDATAPIAAAPTVQPLGSVSSTGAPQPGTPEALYENAFALVKDQKYDAAQSALQAFLKDNPNHSLAGNAQYWLGETYYARQQYKDAAKAFALGYQKYRRAPKAADNLLKLALSLDALGNKDDACVTLGQFKSEYKDAAPALKAKADEELKKLACGA